MIRRTTTAVALTILLSLPGKAIAGFTDNGDGTVTDTATNIMWQQQDDGTVKNWAEALTYCENLSLGDHDDWRAPNIKELKSIIDTSRTGRTVDTRYFLNTKGGHYWSSTTAADPHSHAWVGSLVVGKVELLPKTTTCPVLCVRYGMYADGRGERKGKSINGA
jgi:hypothetical protein